MNSGAENKSDEEVAFFIQSGETELFDVLVKRYEAKLGRYARKFLSGADDINDVLQDIFIKIYTNIKSFDAKRKFSSWAYRIAHNELVNALRKRQRIFLPVVNLDVFLPYDLSGDDFKNDSGRRDTKKMVEEYLDRLKPKYREPIILYYIEGLSYKEIADVMQVPVSTVGIRIKRAKEMLKAVHKNLQYKYGELQQ